jgi:hypothetical protein
MSILKGQFSESCGDFLAYVFFGAFAHILDPVSTCLVELSLPPWDTKSGVWLLEGKSFRTSLHQAALEPLFSEFRLAGVVVVLLLDLS